MNSIEFEIKLTLTANLTNQRIKLFFQNKNLILERNNTKEITLFVSYNENVNRIKLIDFSQFLPESKPYIKIQKMSINDYDVKDFYHLLSFDMKDNLYVENKKINCPQMIDFNGSLYLEVNSNRDRFIWYPITFSKNKNEIVFRNDDLNCPNKIGCWPDGHDHNHNPPWQQFNFDQYLRHKDMILFKYQGIDRYLFNEPVQVDLLPTSIQYLRHDYYDYIALGCSVTAGTAILKRDAWPSLLEQEGWNVLNLGVPGGGNDQIFLNVKELLRKKIKFSKMIILCPSSGRRLLRIPKHGFFFNCFINSNKEYKLDHFNIYFKKNELHNIYRKAQRNLVMSDYLRRDTRVIKRLVSLLIKNSIDFYISSWDDDIYNILRSYVHEKNLLPQFNAEKDRSVGVDRRHPAEHIHKKWFDIIKNQISH